MLAAAAPVILFAIFLSFFYYLLKFALKRTVEPFSFKTLK